MKNKRYKAKDFFESQKFAISGLKLILKNEKNFRIELVIAVVAIALGFIFKIEHSEWIAVSLVISMVLISEAINSAMEALCDAVTQEFNINIKYVKDVSAGAVWLSAFASFVTGLIVFLPYIWDLVKKMF